MNQDRLNRVIAKMKKHNLTQLIIADPIAIFYLTGSEITADERLLVLLIDNTGACTLFINAIFPNTAQAGLEIITYSDTDEPIAILAKHIRQGGIVGVDKSWPARFLLDFLKTNSTCRINTSTIMEEVRLVKDSEEIQLMRQASLINDKAIEKLIELVPARFSEQKMAKLLAAIYEDLGAEGQSFAPIICYGANAADPHHVAGDAVVSKGDCVVLDIGCSKDRYCSDMTRTVFFKSVSTQARDVYQIVLEANLAAIKSVAPGMKFCDIDAIARAIITEAGYGEYYIHRTGHSVGLEVHESGDVSSENCSVVEAGMVFSVEPGIYLPGKFGVRIEDLVVVTAQGCEVLNNYPKGLKIVE